MDTSMLNLMNPQSTNVFAGHQENLSLGKYNFLLEIESLSNYRHLTYPEVDYTPR